MLSKVYVEKCEINNSSTFNINFKNFLNLKKNFFLLFKLTKMIFRFRWVSATITIFVLLEVRSHKFL
jgi:hypothetical protein